MYDNFYLSFSNETAIVLIHCEATLPALIGPGLAIFYVSSITAVDIFSGSGPSGDKSVELSFAASKRRHVEWDHHGSKSIQLQPVAEHYLLVKKCVKSIDFEEVVPCIKQINILSVFRIKNNTDSDKQDEMDKIEVDPRLFITCRLCLEDLGLYQIVPTVKEQILFCFDINVEPFDGLPQLICKKCEAILTNFTETKKTIIEKQNELKNKLQESSGGGPDLPQVESNVNNIEEINKESPEININATRRRKPLISSSSSDFEFDKVVNKKRSDKNNDIHKATSSWPLKYTKMYVCRFCNLRCANIKKLKSHIKVKHFALNRKYSSVFKRHCEVRLPKIDEKPNVTGSRYKVVYTNDKIIENVNPKYYVVYVAKGKKDYETFNSAQEEDSRTLNSRKTVSKGCDSSDSLDDEVIVKRKRIKRLCSRSSNETVVLDTANKSNSSDNDKESRHYGKVPTPIELGECINIDDSTSSESENAEDVPESKGKKNHLLEIKKERLKPDEVTIDNIIANCQNKYIKKHYTDNFMMKSNKNHTEIATQLKHKILSIGRKLINKKKGINCTPLLRFLERKNVDITWGPRTFVNQESNYIRVIARIKNIGENFDYETGWTDYSPPPSNLSYGQLIGVASHISKGDRISPKATDKVARVVDNSEAALTNNAVSIADANHCGADTKILLNANPVPNPKQLPKKSTVNDIKTVKNNCAKQVAPNIEILENNDAETELCMPIITSTTSLAAGVGVGVPLTVPDNISSNQPEDTNSTSNHEPKADGPRIKVKPPSELMSIETLSRMKTPVQMPCIVTSNSLPAQNENNFINIYVPPMSTVSQFQNNVEPNNQFAMSFSPEPSWKNDYMVLDTTELPNTTTNSPFQYFRRLLQLHNITLLDTDVELSNDFHCLIKFKVVYKQETNIQPVILCLALFCSKNVFCLKIKDRNQENINISRISPNWQWEVLKIYKGEVVNKLLNNAQKIGQDVHEFTNSFLCLLKSINLVVS